MDFEIKEIKSIHGETTKIGKYANTKITTPILMDVFVDGTFSHNELQDLNGNILWSNISLYHSCWMGIVTKIENNKVWWRGIDEYGVDRKDKDNEIYYIQYGLHNPTQHAKIGQLYVCTDEGHKLLIDKCEQDNWFINRNRMTFKHA